MTEPVTIVMEETAKEEIARKVLDLTWGDLTEIGTELHDLVDVLKLPLSSFNDFARLLHAWATNVENSR